MEFIRKNVELHEKVISYEVSHFLAVQSVNGFFCWTAITGTYGKIVTIPLRK